MLRRPLWPARPPPTLTRTVPGGQVELVVDDRPAARDRRCRSAARGAATAWPVSFMYVSGKASTTRSAAEARPRRRARVVAAGLAACRRACRRASSRRPRSPTLWRVRAYSLPGLPSPTTSQSNGVEPRDVRSAVTSDHSAASPPSAAASASSPSACPRPLGLVGGLDLGQLGGIVEHGDDRRSRGRRSAVTPAGIGEVAEADDVADCMSLMSTTISLGMWRGVVTTSIVSTAGSTRPPLGEHRLGLALEAQRHVDGDLLVHVDLEEVDVGDGAAHRVALQVLDDRRVARAVDLEVEHGVEPGRAARARRSSRRSTVTRAASMPWP